MTRAHTWNCGAAAASIQFADSLGVVELRGPLTRRALDQLKVDVMRLAPCPTYVFVVDVSAAIVAVDVDELAELALDSHLHGVIKEPIVFVVNDEQTDLFRAHSEAIVEHGLLRVVATSLDRGLEWAQRRAMTSAWTAELRADGRNHVSLAARG